MRKKRFPFLIIGCVILLFFIWMALFPQTLTPYGRKMSFGPWLTPCKEHILGTNALGYDIFTELVYGAKDTILIGLCSSLLAILLGVFIGLMSTIKGPIGALFDGFIHLFILLPKLITLIVLAAFIGSSALHLTILIAVFSWVKTAREVRSKIIHLKTQPYIEICQLYGYSSAHISFYHILPNLKDVLLTRFLMGITSCIMMESTLSFLGFGDIYFPTWGVMINFAQSRGALLRGAYFYLLAPCLCIMLLSLSFYFISLYIDGKQNTILDN